MWLIFGTVRVNLQKWRESGQGQSWDTKANRVERGASCAGNF